MFIYTFGVVSSLILGVGIPFTIGLGIVIGCFGIGGVSVNYPLYKKIVTKSKNKYATDIIRLANEIVNEE